jgi:hypothetical protein
MMGSFFRNQTFPDNFYRRSKAGGGGIIAEYINTIHAVHPEVVPGANNPQGVFIPDNITEVTSFFADTFIIINSSLASFHFALFMLTSPLIISRLFF